MCDLASPHTAAAMQKVLKTEEVKALPRFPKPADANPLDAFVWNSLKGDVGKAPMDTRNTVGKAPRQH